MLTNQLQRRSNPRQRLSITLFLFTLLVLCIASHSAQAASVTLAWDANTDPVAGYRLHYGHASRSYQSSVDVGNVTSYTWSGLAEGRTYYFAVTAYNASNLESSPSSELICHTITGSSGPGGGISPSGTVFVTAGQSQTFTSSPSIGYTLGNLAVDGVSQGALGSYTFSNVAAPHTISASFAPKTYTINASVNGNGGTISPSGAQTVSHGGSLASVNGSGGTISPSGAQTVSHGGSLAFTIAPNAGYDVGNVVVDGVSRGAITSYTFTSVTAGHAAEGALVTLMGSHSRDPENTPIAYVWEQTEGPEVTLSSATAADPTFTTPDVGPEGAALTFRLTVTDGSGAQSTDSCIVNVTWVNIPPVASAGPDQTVEEWGIVTLDGSRSTDLDDGIAIHSWKQVGGPTVDLDDSTLARPTFVAPAVAVEGDSLVFELTVMDTNGLKATDSCIVNVSWVNHPPVASAGPDQTVQEGAPVILDGSGSSDDAGITSHYWKQSLGTPVILASTTSPTLQFTAPVITSWTETLTFSLTVADAAGLQSEDTVQVTVSKQPGRDLLGDWTTSSYDGTTFRGALQVRNMGNTSAGTFKVAVYLSSNGTALTKLIRTTTVYGLSAGAAKNLSLSYRSRGISGQYVIAVVDSSQVIQELNETNNQARVQIR